jgi:hypothetical protein
VTDVTAPGTEGFVVSVCWSAEVLTGMLAMLDGYIVGARRSDGTLLDMRVDVADGMVRLIPFDPETDQATGPPEPFTVGNFDGVHVY